MLLESLPTSYPTLRLLSATPQSEPYRQPELRSSHRGLCISHVASRTFVDRMHHHSVNLYNNGFVHLVAHHSLNGSYDVSPFLVLHSSYFLRPTVPSAQAQAHTRPRAAILRRVRDNDEVSID